MTITIAPAPGAVYPVVTVRATVDPALFDGPLRGAPYRTAGDATVFSIWDAPALADIYGEPADDAGRAHLAWIRGVYHAVDLARQCRHPWMQNAPAPLMPHQRAGWAMMLAAPFGAIFYEPGLGKTATAITADAAKRANAPGGTLVICPVTLIYDTWAKELDAWAPNATVGNLHKYPGLAQVPYDVWLINPEKLRSRRSSLLVKLAAAGLRRIIVDESSTMKNDSAQFTDAVLNKYGTTAERYILSGRPAPNTPLEYWPQINFVAPGLLGTTKREFRDAWFEPDPEMPKRWRVQEGRHGDLMRRIGRVAIYSPEEIIGLPQPAWLPQYCDLPANLHNAYDMLRGELRAAWAAAGDKQQKRQILARIMRLRELACGYIVGSDGKWNLVGTHKFDALERVLQQCEGHQVIVWCTFNEDFPSIARLLPHRHAKAGYIWGRTQNKSYRRGVMDRFRGGELQYLFANPRTLKYGVTLFEPGRPWACNHAVDLNFSYSLEDWEQAHYRNRRIGQTKHNFYFPLIVRGTIEEVMYHRLREKRDDSDEGLEFLR